MDSVAKINLGKVADLGSGWRSRYKAEVQSEVQP